MKKNDINYNITKSYFIKTIKSLFKQSNDNNSNNKKVVCVNNLTDKQIKELDKTINDFNNKKKNNNKV